MYFFKFKIVNLINLDIFYLILNLKIYLIFQINNKYNFIIMLWIQINLNNPNPQYLIQFTQINVKIKKKTLKFKLYINAFN